VTDPVSRPAVNDDVPHEAPPRVLTDAARRALVEAEARRAQAADAQAAAVEHGGRAGPDPTRYGDWEKKGLAIDF